MDRNCPGPSADGTATGAIDLGLFLDGVLPEDSAIQAEIHVATCGACTARLRKLRDLKATLEDRSLWAERPAPARTACLSAADVLLLMEGFGSDEAKAHVATCTACAVDVKSIEDSSRDFAAGRLERLDTDLLTALRRVGQPQPKATDSTDEALAPIIVLGTATAPREERVSKRLSPRPSRKTKPVRTLSARRPAAVTGGIFAFAAAAAAVTIVALVAAQSGETPSPGPEVARKAPPKNTNANKAPVAKPDASAHRSAPVRPKSDARPDVTEDEPTAPPEVPGPSAQVPPEAVSPAPDAVSPAPPPVAPESGTTVARAPETAAPPSPLDAPVTDDGSRLALDLSRVSGALAMRASTGSESWSALARKDGQLALKPGDRLRTNGGAFLSLEGGTYEVCLAPKTELVVRGNARGPVIGLADGRILCEVEKLPADKRMVVATGSGDFEVVGTVFSVAADAKQATCAVEEGTVLCRGQAGEPRALPAGYALSIARGAAPGEPRTFSGDEPWARGLRPERQMIYAAHFDRGDLSGFNGTLVTENAFRGVGRSLLFEPIDGNKFWGLAARAPKGKVKPFRAGPDVRLQFSFWLEKDSHVLVQLLNDRQGKNFKRDLGTQPGNRWVTVTIPVFDLETYYDPGKNPVREGDLFSEIELYTGDPGDRWTALLDDVLVYKKSYR